MIYNKGDIIILRGKNENTGRVIEYDKKKKSYLIDRGYKQSWVWEVNIVGKENNNEN